MNNNKITTDLSLAVAQLRAGNLVAFPTETVYGLGAAADNPAAIQKVFQAKGRPADHPVIVHIGAATQLKAWATDIPETAWILAEQFWPGSLTMVLKKQQHVSDLVSGGQDTIGIRIPKHPLTLKLLQEFGSGIVGPSANKYGRVSPTQAQHVAQDLADQQVLILDGGEANVGIESTIVDLTNTTPIIRRLGAITAEQIAQVLKQEVQIDITHSPNMRVPGSHAAHYAPRTPTILVSSTELQTVVAQHALNKKVSVLSWQTQPANLDTIYWQNAASNPDAYAHDLYANLRDHDQLNNDLIIIEAPAESTAWAAILDRLKRASTH